ncbi:hypothetical protein Anas_04501, partial [Armadillidium nasatum]
LLLLVQDIFYLSFTLLVDKRNCKDCDKVLGELENIDDDSENFGVQFVKVADKKLAKSYGIKTFPALSYFRNKEPMHYEDKHDCRKCVKVLAELENIDDDADQLGIAFVKINDPELADEYSLGTLPALVYYRRRIPVVYDGDLLNEDKVLEWLVANKNTGDDDDTIEDVTLGLLNTLIDSMDHLAVIMYDRDEKDDMQILTELENIDDELDKEGIHIVKICDESALREFGIESTPALVYFENEVDDEEDGESQQALAELENIDDECDSHGIVFVKIDNKEEAAEYGIDNFPTMVYFEKSIPSVYFGSLLAEDEVLDWLIHQVENEEIEEVTDEMLDKLIEKTEHLAVLFYDKNQRRSKKVLSELENIDDDCDNRNIVFVKIDNEEEAKEYGIETIP